MPPIQNPMYRPLTLPPDFPRQIAEDIESLLRTDPAPILWFHFGGAWLAMAYRFTSAAEASDAWAASFGASGSDAPPMDERYAQERDLFAFASNAS